MSEAIIIGAGPAGAIAALVLARAGVGVLVIDRAKFPRDKLCGDTVNPGALAILARLGIGEVTRGALPVDGMMVSGPTGVRAEGRYGDRHQGRALSRRVLDAALIEAVARAGAKIDEGVLAQRAIVERGRVRGVVVGVGGRERELRAPVVIAADGAHSRIARALQLSASPRTPRRWAVGAYFENVDQERPASLGEMHLRPGRYIGIAPLPGDVTNACVVTADRAALGDPGRLLQQTLATDPMLAPRFARARQVTRPTCLGPLAVESRRCAMPGLLLAGDAAGFIDPMTGDGLRFAFRGGELAAEAALAALGGTPDTEHWLTMARQREFAPKWRFNRILRSLTGSPAALATASHAVALAPWSLRHVVRYAGDCGEGSALAIS